MIPYLECPHPDDSKITLQYFEHISDVPYLNESHSVPLHQHEFYEMVVILRGFCHHFYRDANVLLIPGDLFLIPPNQPHSYQFYDDITLCNCQFYREALGNVPENFIGDVNYLALQQKTLPANACRIWKHFRKMREAFHFGIRAISTAKALSISTKRNERYSPLRLCIF